MLVERAVVVVLAVLPGVGRPGLVEQAGELVRDLKDGSIDALIAQDPFRMGYEAVKTLVDKLHGTNPPKLIDLSATVVTKGDLEKPEIKALLFPDVKKYLN